MKDTTLMLGINLCAHTLASTHEPCRARNPPPFAELFSSVAPR